MDRPIESKKFATKRNAGLMAAGMLGLVLVVYMVTAGLSAGQAQKLSLDNLTTSKVLRGRFEEALNVRGILNAKTTVYLDAVAGGIVEERLVEQGTFVTKGQPLVRLSNTTLQFEVVSREAQISEQLNFLRNNQLLAETTRLQLRSDILENENHVAHLRRKVEQMRPLVERRLLPEMEIKELEQDLRYYENRNRIALERQKQEEAIRKNQLSQLEDSVAMLTRNLAESRKALDNLVVKAPVDGFLSELDVELGESKVPGARLGRIDVPGNLKAVASLDEYYLNRVALGIPAQIAINGKKHSTVVSKVDGRVHSGSFVVEIDLPPELNAAALTLGQSVDIELVLGAGHDDALMIQRGPFVNDTGGNWIFVLSADQSRAQRRAIKLGSRNSAYYEVLDGLDVGETVVISSYGAFDKAETLRLQ